MQKLLTSLWIAVLFFSHSGCSSLDLSLWPSSFPLLRQTKELAMASPNTNGLSRELSKQSLPEYFLEPGDRILIEPVKLDSKFTAIGEQEIQIDGSIDLGRLGRLRVSGLTIESIEYGIEERIREIDGEPESINVQLVETNSAEVYVLGEVGSPGAYVIDGHETVLDAILMAGGLTSRASPCDIILVRPTNPNRCRVVLSICYRQLTQIGDVATNYQLQPGDRIVVGPRTFREEIAFWRQTSSCEKCACNPCVECSPSSVSYSNRFLEVISQFPLPRKFKTEKSESVLKDGSQGAVQPESIQPLSEKTSISPSDEEKVFLKPLNEDPAVQNGQ